MKVAKNSFFAVHNGADFLVHAGDTIDDNHPVARNHPDHFKEAGPKIKWDGGVEEATVNPGQQRTAMPRPLANETVSVADLRIIAKHETGKDYGTKEDLIKRIQAHRRLG